MNDTDLRILQLHGSGYCCAQIFILLCLENMQRENPDLVRAAQGLCLGMGDCSGPCGILSGGLCALSLYAGKGTDYEQAEEQLPVLAETFRDWFREKATVQHGGFSCEAILGEKSLTPNPERCGQLLTASYEQLINILLEAGLDPAEGRDVDEGY
ncbi:DVU_1555 family C-GCAxxG-C-C protein [Maridesulfovibrio sp. FT414]|uniref:DVU_1555 family C-GCAxxG-C-C protein n=1 Tax=Maridesulfovibrio sp. FT414 TaxID=2979469 RepID=UPI003D80549F